MQKIAAEDKIKKTITTRNFLEIITDSEENWNHICRWVENVLKSKEADENKRQNRSF